MERKRAVVCFFFVYFIDGNVLWHILSLSHWNYSSTIYRHYATVCEPERSEIALLISFNNHLPALIANKKI